MSLKKGLVIFTILSVLSISALLYFTVDASSLESFKNADLRYIALALVLVALMWVADAMKIKTLSKAADEDVPFSLAIKLTWINYFGAALTPMQSGGGPFQMYLMYRHGISIGKTVAITLVRTFFSIIVLGLSIPISIIMKDQLPEMGLGMKGYMIYISFVVIVAASAFFLSIFKPNIIISVVDAVVRALIKIHLLKPERREKVSKWLTREIEVYRGNIRSFFTTGIKMFITSFLLTVVQMGLYLSVMPCLILSLGYELNFVHCMILQALFIFSLYFMPTPGGSGAAEGGAALVASFFVSSSSAGIIGVGWRLITEYTGIILGIVVAIRGIGWSVATKLAKTKHGGEVSSMVDDGMSSGKKD